jgi:hypothetical protein
MSPRHIRGIRAGVGVAAALLTLCAVGSSAAGAQSLPGTHGVSRGSERSITITQSDSGRSYALAVGDRLTVMLSGSTSKPWTMPSASNHKVLARKSGASGTTAWATFQAMTAGKTTLSATHITRCSVQCGAMAPLVVPRQFHVAISVN